MVLSSAVFCESFDCLHSLNPLKYRYMRKNWFLPPAYVVRREGNVLTCVCPSIHQSVRPQVGYPYPIMLCNITQNSMGQTPRGGTLPGPPRGVPFQVQLGGYPAGGVPCQGYPAWGIPCQGYPARRYPSRVPPLARSGWGGTQVGQQKEYSIHSRWYASCVHAGGLSFVTSHILSMMGR